MKKIVILLITILFTSGFAFSIDLFLEVKGKYFLPSEDAFQDIYGSGIKYGGEINIGVLKNLYIWFGGDYFSKNGELTFTGEETTIKITPIGGGLKYMFEMRGFKPYLGLGILYNQYSESNVIGDVNEGGMGFIGKLGVNLIVAKGLLMDFFIDYSYCKMTPADFTINIGGIAAGIGLGYKF